ncbi:MAG: hypothetical protein LC641_01905 [Spirochaeta sp.]|nr:hypothetical protein [Spirochaeta sp.]
MNPLHGQQIFKDYRSQSEAPVDSIPAPDKRLSASQKKYFKRICKYLDQEHTLREAHIQFIYFIVEMTASLEELQSIYPKVKQHEGMLKAFRAKADFKSLQKELTNQMDLFGLTRQECKKWSIPHPSKYNI